MRHVEREAPSVDRLVPQRRNIGIERVLEPHLTVHHAGAGDLADAAHLVADALVHEQARQPQKAVEGRGPVDPELSDQRLFCVFEHPLQRQ